MITLKAHLKKVFKGKVIPGQPTNKSGKPYKEMYYNQAYIRVDDMNYVTEVQDQILGIVVGVCVKDYKHRRIHQIHIRQLVILRMLVIIVLIVGILACLGIVEIRNHRGKVIPGQPANKSGKPYKEIYYNQAYIRVDDMDYVTEVQDQIRALGFHGMGFPFASVPPYLAL